MLAQQREKMRLQRVQEQCVSLINSLESQLKETVENPNYSTFIGNIDNTIQQLEDIRQISTSNPDKGLQMVQESSQKVSNILSIAISRHEQWSDNQRIAYKEISQTVNEIKAIPVELKKLQVEMKSLIDRLDAGLDIATMPEQLKSFVNDIREKANVIKEKDEKEVIRKEVVKKVIDVFENQGFIVDNPRIKDNIVYITSKTPSGKIALFQIHDDNMMNFDFEGYEGTTCKDQLEAILEKLSTEEEVETGIEQFVWKNPDRIKKGAKEAPYSPNRYMSAHK
jgi:DNA-binding MarR family transcriptional regulator